MMILQMRMTPFVVAVCSTRGIRPISGRSNTTSQSMVPYAVRGQSAFFGGVRATAGIVASALMSPGVPAYLPFMLAHKA